MNTNDKLAAIKRKTRQRFMFALIVMALYFSFALNYIEGGSALIAAMGVGSVSGALVMFTSLIVIFIALEVLFLFLNRRRNTD